MEESVILYVQGLQSINLYNNQNLCWNPLQFGAVTEGDCNVRLYGGPSGHRSG